MEMLRIEDRHKTVVMTCFVVFSVVGLLFLLIGIHWLFGIGFFTIGFFVFSIKKEYVFTADFQNRIVYRVFKKQIVEQKLDLEYPDYISVFHARYKRPDEYVQYTDYDQYRYKKWTVRFFKENRSETIFEEYKYEEALKKAQLIGRFFDIEVYDASKV